MPFKRASEEQASVLVAFSCGCQTTGVGVGADPKVLGGCSRKVALAIRELLVAEECVHCADNCITI